MRSILFSTAVTCALGATSCGGVVAREYHAKDARVIKSAAVLTLENLTSAQDEGKVVADLLSTALSARNIEVVDRARAESSLARVDVISGGTVDRLAAQRVGELLGVDAVVYGSVAEAGDGKMTSGPRHADIGVTVRVLDVKSGSYILAGSYTSCAGSDSLASAAHTAADRIAKAVGR